MRDGLLAQSQPLQPADTLREQLTRIFDTARTKKGGLRRIDLWRQRVEKSGQRCFDGVLTLLDTWLELIATSFIRRQSRAFVEGQNSTLKGLKRRCAEIYNVVLQNEVASLFRVNSCWAMTVSNNSLTVHW